MDLILFGMQGSGKGTQGKILAQKYNLTVFEMGGQLRQMIASGSELGNKVKSIVNSGHLVDDDTIMEVVESFLAESKEDQPILFDGIPRTFNQSQKLSELLKNHNRQAFAVLIKISQDEAIERLTKRRICENCKGVYPSSYQGDNCEHCEGRLVTRQDDNIESINKRLHTYEAETVPVVNKFYDEDRLIEVDGEQAIDKVTSEMIEKVDYLFT